MVACVVNGLLGAPDCNWGFAGNFFGALQGGGHAGLRCVKHLVDQAIGQGLGGRHATASVGVFLGDGFGDELGQALQRAHIRHHADVDLLNAEEGIAGRIAHAAACDHIHRAADAATLNGEDDRDAQALDFAEGVLHVGEQVENGGPAFGALVVHLDAATKGLQRHACAEMLAGAGDDQGTGAVVFV